MLDLAILRRPAFAGSVVVSLLGTFAMAGFAVFSTQYLQLVLGMSPLRGALWSLVPSVAVGAAAPLASVLARRGVDRAKIIAAGFLAAVAGFVVLSAVPVESGLWVLLAGAGMYAAGLVVVMSTATELVVGTVPPERAGASAALMETASEFGGALGIALLGSIGAAVYRARLGGDDLPAPARETLSGAVSAAAHLPQPAAAHVLEAAREAFVGGMHAVAWVGAAVMLFAAVVALVFLRAQPADAPQTGCPQPADKVAV
jgi:DHA2 family multidrug resistance protein-like MFS transporter